MDDKREDLLFGNGNHTSCLVLKATMETAKVFVPLRHPLLSFCCRKGVISIPHIRSLPFALFHFSVFYGCESTT